MDITQPELIPYPWATNGQKAAIPENQTSPGNGRASWNTGFPIENTYPVSANGVPANYQDFQGVLYTLSEFACYQQAGGIFTYDATLDYQPGARVLGSDGNVYRALAKNGPATVVAAPVGDTSGKWVLEPNMTQVSSAASAITQNYVTSGGYTISGDVTYGGDVTVSGTVNGGGVVHLVGNETISGTKTFTNTISGTITNATSAGQATKLTTARAVQTNLGATTSATFDGTANIAPGVTGTLAVANGGTGVTAIADIQAGKDGAGNNITDTYATKTDVADEMATKADIDGNYPDMTVGNAEQLISNDYVTDSAPYNFRTAGGDADIGDREYDELVGGTIAWNQFCPAIDSTHWTGGSGSSTPSSITYDNGVVTFLPSAGGQYVCPRSNYVRKGDIGHKYLFIVDAYATLGACQMQAKANTTVSTTETNKWQRLHILFEGTFNTQFYPLFAGRNYEEGQSISLKNALFFDLTQMFGTAIADHIYALEQANAGAGLAWFKKLFPKDYYAYNAGELMSVQAASHDMVGFNAYDPESGTAELVGGNQYQISGTYTALAYSTGEAITPDASGLFTPASNGTLTVTGGNATDTCVHLVWSGYRNGEYEPYEKHSYPLDSTLTLRGIPKLDASNNLYYDGDIYEADGTVTRRYASVTFDGTATGDFAGGAIGINQVGDGYYYLTFSLSSSSALKHKTVGANNVTFDAVCGKFTQLTYDNIAFNSYNNQSGGVAALGIPVYSIQGNWAVGFSMYVPNCTTKEEYKTYLTSNPLTIVYELATPTTETADAFQTPQIVSDFGTEQYVDAAVAAGTRDVAIPVGHDTKYIANLVDKLRRLPDAPDAGGNYLVHYDASTRRASYTAYIGPTELPAAPTTDGTFTLQCTVTEGVPTYEWVGA